MKKNLKLGKLFVFYFLSALFLEILLIRTQNQRYLVSFLPFLVIPAAYVLETLWKGSVIKKLLVILSVLVPIISSTVLILNPFFYITELSKVTKYSELFYVYGQTSGYGIKDATEYIEKNTKPDESALVLFALNAGNPENAIDLFTQQHSNLYGIYIDSRIFKDLDQVDCLSSDDPVFFVTRTVELSGMDKYFTLEKSFPNPDGKYFVGVYTLKKDCQGKTQSLSEFYQPAVERMNEFKKK